MLTEWWHGWSRLTPAPSERRLRSSCMHSRIFATIVCMSALRAQEKPLMELSLKQAVEIALTPDGATRARLARETITTAKTQERQALGALLPNVDGYLGYSRQTVNLKAFGLSFTIPGF